MTNETPRPLSVGVALLGHPGHGKTTLASELTRIASRTTGTTFMTMNEIMLNPAEQRRGFSMNLSVVPLQTRHRRIALLDCPGNRKYMRNCIAGLSSCDVVLLVVDAVSGPTEITWAQLRVVAHMLPVPVLVFLNRVDRADQEQVQFVEFEVTEMLKELGLYQLEAVQHVAAVLEALDRVPTPSRNVAAPFRMPIARVAPVPGRGTFVWGRIDSGSVRVGDKLDCVGGKSGRVVVVSAINRLSKQVREARAGDQVELLLRKVAPAAVSRGQVLAAPGTIHATTELDVVVELLPRSVGGVSLSSTHRPQIHLSTAESTVDLELMDGTLDPGQCGQAKITLARPLAVRAHEPFVLRANGRVVALGHVLEVSTLQE